MKIFLFATFIFTFSVTSAQYKKTVVILLPSTVDSAMLNQTIRFRQRHANQINIIAMVENSKAKPEYKTLSDSGIVVTEGLPTGSSSPGKLEALLNWITAKSRDRKSEAAAEGRKYFITEDGRLYAVLGPETTLDFETADYLVNMQVPAFQN